MFFIRCFYVFFLGIVFSSSADELSFSFSEKEGLKTIEEPLLRKENSKKESSKQESANSSKSLEEQTKKPKQNKNNLSHNLGDGLDNSLVIHQETTEEEDEKNKFQEQLPSDSKQATQISESFAPEEKNLIHEAESFFQEASWIWSKKQSQHKTALVPIYSYDKTENSRLGFRFFTFSPEKKGYYLAVSGAKYWSKNYYSSRLTYKSKRYDVFRNEISFIYDDHYELHYTSLKETSLTKSNLQNFEGMEAPLSQPKKMESHRLILDYNLFYQEKEMPLYFGAGARAFFRQERKILQDNKSFFPSEYFIFLRVFTGFDTRDNWKYPKKGGFHQVSLGCKASLVFSSSYCQTHADLRFYNSPSKQTEAPFFIRNSVFSLRAFYGTSLINASSYATKYSLGGESFFQHLNNLRAFKSRRFLGDKIYLGQSELKIPVWKEYLIISAFLEIGETTQKGESFDGFVTSYGGGIRLGWPNDSGMKIRLDYSMGKDRQSKTNKDFIISFLQAF